MNICLSLISVYLIIMSMILNTKNFISALVFKIIPFFLGVWAGFFALKSWGLI